MDIYKFKYYINVFGISLAIAATFFFALSILTNNFSPVGLILFSLNWLLTLTTNDLFKEYMNQWFEK
ncbi:hypothetical protein JOC85_002868 [Bacillus mesophilus]|uniref:Uncharacterized protein n=1 Tax=Bacillus mesophilus TaxID=1808955 RepID=A0A6M0Q8C1_9BACI|nr:hypothetical protein [Bacillus mesophilus]MBM7662061.1 hypothetical protein [Bacillus mesophilus]NEY72584.1 hypothetical protein [Bacillus mesophilus]